MAFADGCEVVKTVLKASNVLNNSNTLNILEALSTHEELRNTFTISLTGLLFRVKFY